MNCPVTLDASLLIRASTRDEPGCGDCERALLLLGERKIPLVMPTLILVEMAAALGRRGAGRSTVSRVLERVRTLPASVFLPLDESLAEDAAALALEYKLRGADAVYVATARRAGAILLTVDEEQLSRAPSNVVAMRPEHFLTQAS